MKKRNDDDTEIDTTNWRVVARGAARRERKLTLTLLRRSLDLSQQEVASRAKITQSEVSRAEQRDDSLVSTLERYAKALGGSLLLYVEIDGRKYPIVLGGDPAQTERRASKKRTSRRAA